MARGNALSLAWQEHPPIQAVFGTPKVGVTPFVSGRPATGSDIAQYHTYQVLACAGGQWHGPGWILCPDMPGLRSAQADYGSAQRSLWKSPTNDRGSADARVRGTHLRLTD